MQVGFSPINIKSPAMNQPKRQLNVNFNGKIPVGVATGKPQVFARAMKNGAYEHSDENVKLLKEVIKKTKSRSAGKWDIPLIKEAVLANWGDNDNIKKLFD